MLTDSHCHLDFPEFDSDRSNLIEVCQRAGVCAFVVPATTRANWGRVIHLARTYSCVQVALGIHPYFLSESKLSDLDGLGEIAENNQVIAVGEIGLDYWPGAVEKALQKRFVESQLQIAKALRLPIIVHARKSYDDMLQLLKRLSFQSGGIVHAFNGSVQQAMRFLDLGFVLGIGGTVTYPRAQRARATLFGLSDKDYVLETDSPDMPIYGRQGERNTPVELLNVADVVASLRDQSVEIVAKNTNDNLKRVLPLWRGI